VPRTKVGEQDSSIPSPPARAQGFLLLAVLALGAALRLWNLGSQIPFDDEWHAIRYVLDHGLAYLFTHYSRLGANSVPHNLYLRLMLDTFGLSEWSIVFPSLIAGILLLWYYPRWVGQHFGARAAVLSGLIVALAPFLIFHSRFARPYAPLLLLEFLALAHLSRWTNSARRSHAISAVVLGALAIWVHVTAFPPLLAAWATACLLQWRQRRLGPSAKRVVLTGLAMFAIAGALSLPAMLQSVSSAGPAYLPFSVRTAGALLQLVCGSASAETQVVFVGLTAIGLLLAAKQAPRELMVLGSAAAASVAAVLLIHPIQSEVGAIFARYSLPIFLLPAFAIGVAGQTLADLIKTQYLREFVWVTILFGLAGAFYFSGPLPFVQVGTTSFTKHPVFQYDYSQFSTARSRPDPVEDSLQPLLRSQLHPFYARVAREGGKAPLIEYPFVIGEDYNRLYFAQLVHHRPVLAGYYESGASWKDGFGLALDDSPERSEPSRGYLLSHMTIDHVLGQGAPHRGIRFNTVVDISDPRALRASQAQYLLLHWNLAREFLFLEVVSHHSANPKRFVAQIRERLVAALGKPIVDDEVLTVFQVQRSAAEDTTRDVPAMGTPPSDRR